MSTNLVLAPSEFLEFLDKNGIQSGFKGLILDCGIGVYFADGSVVLAVPAGSTLLGTKVGLNKKVFEFSSGKMGTITKKYFVEAVDEGLSKFAKYKKGDKSTLSTYEFVVSGPVIAPDVNITMLETTAQIADAMVMELLLEKPSPKLQKTTLGSASKLLQPVSGTSGSSIYYCIALGPVNIAVRISKDKSVSVRAEGDLTKYGDQLKSIGLAKGGGGHYSVHVKCGDSSEVRRFLAIVLHGMPIQFKEVLNLSKIESIPGVA